MICGGKTIAKSLAQFNLNKKSLFKKIKKNRPKTNTDLLFFNCTDKICNPEVYSILNLNLVTQSQFKIYQIEFHIFITFDSFCWKNFINTLNFESTFLITICNKRLYSLIFSAIL